MKKIRFFFLSVIVLVLVCSCYLSLGIVKIIDNGALPGDSSIHVISFEVPQEYQKVYYTTDSDRSAQSYSPGEYEMSSSRTVSGILVSVGTKLTVTAVYNGWFSLTSSYTVS